MPIVSNAFLEPSSGDRLKMTVVKGRVGEKAVDVLRDTGCSGIVVKKNLVSEDQFTGDFNVMLSDNTARKVPIARITVDTPYLKGQVEAQCLSDAIYDLIIGNVPGARPADEPDPTWQEACAVTTRSQAKKDGEVSPLKVPSYQESPIVDKVDNLVPRARAFQVSGDRTLMDSGTIHNRKHGFELPVLVRMRVHACACMY